MSYTIIYDKLSVDMGDGLFMPIVLNAVNNTFTLSRTGRRVRGKWWDVFRGINGALWQSKEAWEKDCEAALADAACEPRELCSCLGIVIQGTKNTYVNYKGLFVAAINKSISYERLVRDYFVSFRVKVDGEFKLAKSKADFMQMVVADKNPIISIMVDHADELGKWVRHDLYPRKERKKKTVVLPCYFAIEMSTGYFKKLSRNSTHYTLDASCAAQFATEKEAYSKLKMLKQKRPAYSFEVVQIDKPAQFKVAVA